MKFLIAFQFLLFSITVNGQRLFTKHESQWCGAFQHYISGCLTTIIDSNNLNALVLFDDKITGFDSLANITLQKRVTPSFVSYTDSNGITRSIHHNHNKILQINSNMFILGGTKRQYSIPDGVLN